MAEITTIKISKKTKSRLDKLREIDRESYDQVLIKILSILNILKDDPEKAESILKNIDSAIKRRKGLSDKDKSEEK
jgi:hypothetical protein